MSNDLRFIQRLLDAALAARVNAWASQNQQAAAAADADVKRLSAWRDRLQPAPQPIEVRWASFHSLMHEFPWLNRQKWRDLL
jgi:hypothetical protein